MIQAPEGHPAARRPTSALTPSAQDANTSLCTFYEIVAQSKEAAGQDPHAAQQFFVQFITRYLAGDGQSHVRVTTFTRRCALKAACWHTDVSNFRALPY